MKQITYTDLEISAFQAVIFTPELQYSASKIMKSVFPKMADLFNSEPVVFPHSPEMPEEIPRITLKNKNGNLIFEIAPSRTNFTWRKSTDEPGVDFSEFRKLIIQIFQQYIQITNDRVGRVAIVKTSFVKQNEPGLFLARHFCKKEWANAPLDRPENFELHAHKRYQMKKTFNVNSWARIKTGSVKVEDKISPVVLFEQDINTLMEEMSDKAFSQKEIELFFQHVHSECESIMQLYFPKQSKG